MTKTMLSLSERYAELDERYLHPLVILENEEHRQLVHRLRDESAKWLAGRGIDQYSTGPHSKSARGHEGIDRLFDAGQFVGWDVAGRIVSVAAITEPDPDFWTPEEMAEPQAYLTHFHVAEHGKHHGLHLLFAIRGNERRIGSRWLRLDCWRTNTKLHDYYLRFGFERVRTEVVPGRMSGELFQYDLRERSTSPNDDGWVRI